MKRRHSPLDTPRRSSNAEDVSAGGVVEYALGALTVQWVETTQIGTTAGASSGRPVQGILDEWSSLIFGE